MGSRQRVKLIAEFVFGRELSPSVRIMLRTDRKVPYVVEYANIAGGEGSLDRFDDFDAAWAFYYAKMLEVLGRGEQEQA